MFIFIFLYNITGYFAVFKILQFQIRREVEHEIKDNSSDKKLVTISIQNTDIASVIWLKKGKEFKYKGELYDIVKQKTTQEKTFFYCFQDKKEKELFAELDEHIQIHITTNTNRRKRANNYIKKLAKDYFFKFSAHKNQSISFVKVNYHKYLQAYKSVCIEKQSPPPQFI